MDKSKEIYYQMANRKYIEENYGRTQWVQISGHENLNDADAAYWCALVDLNYVESVFRDHGWDVHIGSGGPGFEGIGNSYDYHGSLLNEGFEALLYYRDFYGVKKPYIELAQEFVLLNNLYYDESKRIYYSVLDDGRSEEVVRIKDQDNFFISLSYLTRYAAAKQMAVILYYDVRTKFDESMNILGVTEFSDGYKDKNVFYQIWGGDLNNFRGMAAFSVLMGKKILYPRPVDTCGYWPYEREEEYIDFIIGLDENGDKKTFTCNPDMLANYFGKNPNAPHYLTPVFFKREVLQKYISHPELYRIRDGYLECGYLWGIEIDNHHKDCISAYLGDLGRDLPESERLYWKSYNIVSDEGLSETSFKRDFLCVSAESNMIEHVFKEHYIKINDEWNNKFGWPLFLPLAEDDQYNFDLLRIPLTESQDEFDGLVLSLVKVIIDSLNEKKIQESIEGEKDLKGIGKLEKWLQISGRTDYDEHTKFLRNLQDLRSKGTGHRKGTGYDKIASSFGVGNKDLREVFEDIMHSADEFLTYMASFCNLKPPINI